MTPNAVTASRESADGDVQDVSDTHNGWPRPIMLRTSALSSGDQSGSNRLNQCVNPTLGLDNRYPETLV